MAVVTNESSSSGLMTVFAVGLMFVVVLFLLFYMVLPMVRNSGSGTPSISVPEQLDVNVNTPNAPDGQGQ